MLFLSFATIAHSATFPDLPDVETLTRRSQSVVEGTVILSRTAPCSIGLCSTHTVNVDRTLAGVEIPQLEVTTPGGHLDGLTQRAAGIPLLEPGSQVILFVDRTGTVPLTGLFTVEGDRAIDPLGRTTPTPIHDLESTILRVPLH